MLCILFLFYNVSILKELMRQKTTICDFVDDINLLMKAKIFKNNCITLINAHDNICMSWVKLHDVKFSSLKYQLCHMIKKNVNIKASMIVIDIDKFIKTKKEVKYLKIMFDFKMNWKFQINVNKIKTLKIIKTLIYFAKFTWEAKFNRMRQMLHAMFISQLTHDYSMWYK